MKTQAIRKFVANTGDYDPEDIQSLKEKHLAPNIATSFKEMCHFAYNSLKENNPKMTFFLTTPQTNRIPWID